MSFFVSLNLRLKSDFCIIHLSVAQPIQARVEAAALPCLQTARGPGPILTAQQTESGLDVSTQEP